MHIEFQNTLSPENLYPFTSTRDIADIRIGILTIREKWESAIRLFANVDQDRPLTINSNLIPSFTFSEQLIKKGVHINEESREIEYPWHIFQFNDWALRKDFEMVTYGRTSQDISSTNSIISSENIFIEKGAVVEHCIINASTGPVYIGKDAEIMEGSMIRGPFALCENAVVKMGSKIYGATTIGPNCVVGGEIKNSVFFANSNKAHVGYLGDSVIGEWCNLGAGTTNSNVKNTAGDVMVWNNAKKSYSNVGIKCGLLMGDYSRSAINTSFNTGTVVGVSCNIFGTGFPDKFVPDFTWGTDRYLFEKAVKDIDNWKKLKGKRITDDEIRKINNLYNN